MELAPSLSKDGFPLPRVALIGTTSKISHVFLSVAETHRFGEHLSEITPETESWRQEYAIHGQIVIKSDQERLDELLAQIANVDTGDAIQEARTFFQEQIAIMNGTDTPIKREIFGCDNYYEQDARLTLADATILILALKEAAVSLGLQTEDV